MNNDLCNWTTAPLGKLATVVRGITFPANAKEATSTGNNVCCLRTSNIQKEVEWDSAYFVPANYVKREDQFVRRGDVLMSMANSYELVGKVAICQAVPHPAAFGAFLAAIRPTTSIDGRYLFHMLRTSRVQSELRQGSTQTTNIANISIARLGDIEVPLAPLPEQIRIADKLDSVLVCVDACRERLDRVATLMKRFRQSVLVAAITGRLTADWRAKNGVEGTHWQETTVGALIEDINAGLNVKCEERPPEPHEKGLVKISAVTWGTFNDDESKTVLAEYVPPEKTRIQKGDFLLSRANTIELVGACVIVDKVTRPVYLSDKILRLAMPEDYKYWMLYWLRSPAGRRQIEALASGNQLSMRNLSQANLRSITLPLPSPGERAEITRRVENLLDIADRLSERLATAQSTVERLTPAFLAKAFRGELVPQDPRDEPAAELLKRLAEQRSNVGVTVKASRGRKTHPSALPEEESSIAK